MKVTSTKQGLELNGNLVYATVSDTDRDAKKLLEHYQGELVSVDCQNVTKLDSAGIALLIDWKRWCNSQNKQFQIINAPKNAVSLISSYKLTSILGLKEA